MGEKLAGVFVDTSPASTPDELRRAQGAKLRTGH
jgi:hypothetical protein